MTPSSLRAKSRPTRITVTDFGDVIAEMEADLPTTNPAYTTGVDALDARIANYVGPGSVLVIVGAPDTCKTAIAVCAVRACSLAGLRIAIAAHDHNPRAWPRRLATLDRVISPHEHNCDRDVAAHMRKTYPGVIIGSATVETIAAQLPTSGGVLVVDSVQSARVDERPREDDQVVHLEATMRVLTREAHMRNRWVIVLSEAPITRQSGPYAPRGSAAIAHAADVMITLSATGRATDRRVTARVERPSLGSVALRITALGAMLAAIENPAADLAGIVVSPQRATAKPRGRARKSNAGPKVPDDIAERRVRDLLGEEPDIAQRNIGMRCHIGRERAMTIAERIRAE
ncbi:MAG TPA: hypothetical protein VF331_26620 [Polyangiales bacterium]